MFQEPIRVKELVDLSQLKERSPDHKRKVRVLEARKKERSRCAALYLPRQAIKGTDEQYGKEAQNKRQQRTNSTRQ